MNKEEGSIKSIFPRNKKGQDLSTGAIILIILGVVVLVLLALGFSIGWQKILPWVSPTNTDTIVNQCQVSCTTSDVYGYCSQNRTLRASDLPAGSDGKVPKEVTNTCKFFSTDAGFTKYNVGTCPGLCPVAAPSTP
jgi:hypothetical protein